MANFFEKRDRNIIPNWRSFENTAKLGELNGSRNIKFDSSFKPDITDLLDDWSEFQSIALAGDILGAALVCNRESDDKVKEISRFVLENHAIAPKAVVEAAKSILQPKHDEIQLDFQLSTNDQFNEKGNLLAIYLKINNIGLSLENCGVINM